MGNGNRTATSTRPPALCGERRSLLALDDLESGVAQSSSRRLLRQNCTIHEAIRRVDGAQQHDTPGPKRAARTLARRLYRLEEFRRATAAWNRHRGKFVLTASQPSCAQPGAMAASRRS